MEPTPTDKPKLTLLEPPDEYADNPGVITPPSMENIIPWDGVTFLDGDPDTVLREAIGLLDGCVIIGYKKGGFKNGKSQNDEYFATSMADGIVVNWLADRLKQTLQVYFSTPDEPPP